MLYYCIWNIWKYINFFQNPQGLLYNIDLDYYTLIWMTLYGATKANRAKATGGHVHYNA